MNQFLIKISIKINELLEKKISKWTYTEKAEHNLPFQSLAPLKNADVDHYIDAINWALNNSTDKSIFNIALTGPYGSGKSSIIKTFQSKNLNPKFKFLEISLATFKEELERDNDEESENEQNKTAKTKKSDILRLIELSILQQIFYHEEDSKIPDSRFKKIKSLKKEKITFITFVSILTLLSGLYLFFPTRLENILLIEFMPEAKIILKWASFIILLSSTFSFIFKSIRLLYGLHVSKFKLNTAEIEIDKSISKSILNNHIDEILYFFEVTDYSVVIIEDLDRFRQSEIFTKLREINSLINKSKKVSRDVVFIYAVRDEIFQDKERTKFFDFIIPVIPVINSSNSNETLLSIISEQQYKIGKDLIENISLFVNDMRLLYNIFNEYYLYHKLLGVELNQNKLLAMIVYKNIHPEDFVDLAESKGVLFEFINKKNQYIKDKISKIDLEIIEKRNKLQRILNEKIKDEKELRLIYIAAIINELPNFNGFIIDYKFENIISVSESQQLFDNIRNPNIKYNRSTSQTNNYPTTVNINFDTIEEKINSEISFDDRLNLIHNYIEVQQNKIKQEIQSLEREKVRVRHEKLKYLVQNKFLEMSTNNPQTQLISVLIKSGYIGEDYLDYISLFYEGSISRNDRTFLVNVKNQNSQEFDFSLTKIENTLNQISVLELKDPSVLNYDLLDFVLKNPKYESKLNLIISQLNNESEKVVKFIDGYLSVGKKRGAFMKNLCAIWPEMWTFIKYDSNYTDEKKNEYYKLITINASIEDLAHISNISDLSYDISCDENFLLGGKDKERTKGIIRALNLKFENLNFEKSPKELIDYIYEGNYYSINPYMVENIIKLNGNFNDKDFKTSNFSSIEKSECKSLIDYIDNEFNFYLKNLYLKLPDNILESEKSFLSILNHKKLTFDECDLLLHKVLTKIPLIKSVTKIEVMEKLFEFNRVQVSWNNVIEYFSNNDDQITDSVLSFLSINENVEILIKSRTDGDNSKTENDLILNFEKQFISVFDPISEISKRIFKSFSNTFFIDELDGINVEKLKILVEYDLIEIEKRNYDLLKEKYSPLHISLLKNDPEIFLTIINELKLDESDIKIILNSEIFNIEEKNSFINQIDESLIYNNLDIISIIVSFIFKEEKFEMGKSLIKNFIINSIELDDRIKLLNMNFTLFSIEEIKQMFNTFPYPYSDIGKLFQSPVIPFGTENEFLARNLKGIKLISNWKSDKKGFRIINFKK